MNKKSLSIIIVVVLVVAGVGAFFGYDVTHAKGTNLPSMHITALEPMNALATYETGVIVSDLKALGLPVSLALETATESGTWTSPNSTPQFVDLGWLPDWPDPIAQQMYPMTDYSNGGTFGANEAWTTNATLNSSIALSTAFSSNPTAQALEFDKLYKIFYDQYDYLWLPNPSTYFFVQPYINNFTYNAYENYFYNMMSYNTSYTHNGVKLSPPSNNTLTDVADGDSLAAPDFLDPSHGFYVQDGPLFTAVYQELYELNGTNISQVVPVLAASNPSTSMVPGMNVSNQNYNITLRQNITFSTGTPVNATTVWFSLYRTIVMAQGVSVDNYGGMLFNNTAFASTSPYSVPVGWLHAMRAAENKTSLNSGIAFPDPTNYSNLNATNTEYAAKYLANMLSNYHPWSNATQAFLISYNKQAVVVPDYNMSTKMGLHNNLNITINLANPYPYFLKDMAEWWGNIADPLFLDQSSHDGVTAAAANNYTDVNGMPGTGPYNITTVGSGLNTVTLTKNANYWGDQYWNTTTGKAKVAGFPAVAQPAHIKTIIIDYTVGHDGRVSGFLDNSYQISVVSSSYINSIAGAKPYSQIPFTSYFKDEGSSPAVFYISMNNHKYPTNILDFREAMWYAINQTALDKPYYYNGTYLAENEIGPASPNFALYTNATKGLAPETYNVAMAEHYLNLAGQQGKFYVTLPNGTVLGDVALKKSSPIYPVPLVLSINLLVQNLLTATVRIF